MMKTPDISIIICNYNYADYIGDALESVLAQTLKNWECIVIDDGSTDNSREIIKKFVARDKRFRLIESEHVGASAARNLGLDVATGEYIAFLDSDDCYTEYALQMLLHIAHSTGADMVGGAANLVGYDFRFIKSGATTWNAGLISGNHDPLSFIFVPMEHRWCWVWRRIYRRSLIGDVRFVPEFTTFGDDLVFMLQIAHRANFFVETKNISVFHRVHPNAISGSDFCPKNFEWFPKYFKWIRDNALNYYNANFLRAYYRNTFNYMLLETVYTPKRLNKYELAGKRALIESCKYIPRRYLTWKQRIFCWFLTCLK